MTRDEAIAVALSESLPGDIVSIHSEACGIRSAEDTEQAEALCSCEPLTLTAGAQA